mgnify:CR=1 FL=1
MNKNRLKAVLQSEIDSALGYQETDTTDQRRRSLNAYLREPYGNEREGSSKVVTGEVAEAVDGALPQLMKIFTSSEDVVRFQAKNPQGELGAEQATDYINWVFHTQNKGFEILHTFFKDALLQKVGIIKAFWEEKIDVVKEKYENLSDNELALLLSDETREIVSQETVEQEQIDETGVTVTSFHNVEIKKKNNVGEIQIENLPPEEFLISKRAKDIQTSPFVAHRRLITRSDLMALGFEEEQVRNLSPFDSLKYTPEKLARYSHGEDPNDTDSLDDSMVEIEVYECYLRVDLDDDGIAQLVRVVYAGNEILSLEETDYVPFHSVCPYPLPHKFYGESLADRAMDIQEIKTTITRQMLDNLYLANAPRMGSVEGMVNLDDLLNVTAGGVVRMKSPNAIVPLTVPPVANQAFPMLEYLDQVQGKRTGISDAMQGLSPDLLQNVTAAAIAASTSAAGGKLELIARIFAETGVSSLFKGILQLVCKYQDKPRIIRMRGKYIEMDPRQWDHQYDVSINVGLGTGDQKQQMSLLQMIMSKQEEIIKGYGPSNPLVSIGQYRETLSKFIEAAGFKDVAKFFREIPPEVDQQLSQPKQPQPDPAVQAIMQQAQAKLQIDRQKAEADIALKREKAMADIQLAREEAAAEMDLKKQEFFAEAQLKGIKVANDMTNNTEIPNV